jgi:signal transduction histidine kinase
MRTIRQQLTWKLLLAFGALLGAGGGAVYLSARAALLGQFDTALRAKAEALATLTEGDGSRIKLEFSDEHMPAFEGHGPDFFELWRLDEKTVERSHSLGHAHLPFQYGPADAPRFWNLTLPDGRSGRAIGLRFRTQRSNSNRSGPVEAILAVASVRQELDHTLATLQLVLAGSGLLVLAATVLAVPRMLAGELKPLQALADHAAHIDAGSLSARFPSGGLPGELAPITARLNELLARLEDSFERERRFSADLAHEFRTPLAELRSLAELAAKFPETRSPELEQQVLAIALQMESMLTRLLAIARCERGQALPALERVEVGSLVAAVWRSLQARATARQLALDLNGPASLEIQTELAPLRSIVANLLDNAVEYATPAGPIRLHTQAHNGSFKLCLSNPVQHLSAEDLPHLFERFWRKDAARSGGEHAGLGLALARAFATSLGYTLEATLTSDSRLAMTLSGPVQPPSQCQVKAMPEKSNGETNQLPKGNT